VGPALQDLIDQRGGLKGRIGDLLSDPVSRDSALIVPLISITEFPGFPLTSDEAEDLLNQV
jgi:beta-glucosidase